MERQYDPIELMRRKKDLIEKYGYDETYITYLDDEYTFLTWEWCEQGKPLGFVQRCAFMPPATDIYPDGRRRVSILLDLVNGYGFSQNEVLDMSGDEMYELWCKVSHTPMSEEYLKKKKCSYRSLVRALHRYECYKKETEGKRFKLTVVGFDTAMLTDFETFYRNEHLLYDQYPDIYLEYPAELRMQHSTHRPQQRGDNMVVDVMKRIRAFYNWCIDQGYAVTKPTDKYQGVKTAKYGTPFYLTREERDRIANFDLSARPQLAIQRDIFIFQCLIGCRVSDLYSLTEDNIINGVVEYIPGKTKKDRLDTVRVPLNPKAKEIIERYKGGAKLFPFISQQRYNDAIKEVCKVCGIDRIVKVINPTTGQDERRPIWDVASSHMARRTFIGTLYKQVKDPNLVGALSGHKEGSRAFARYREIDDDIRRDLINLL